MAAVMATTLAVAAIVGIAMVPRISGHAEAAIAARLPHAPTSGANGDELFSYQIIPSSIDGLPLTRMFLGYASNTVSLSAPPGIEHFPQPGEVWLSPALEKEVSNRPELLSMFPGTVVGEISAEGLSHVEELFAYLGQPADEMAGSATGTGFGGGPSQSRAADWLLVMQLVLFVAVPAAFFVLVTARLSTRTRSQRWWQLHLLGVDRRTIARVGGVEAMALSLPGILLGIVILQLGLYARGPKGILGLKWFPSDLVIGQRLALATVLIGSFGVYRIGSRAASRSVAGNQSRSSSIWSWVSYLLRPAAFAMGISALTLIVLAPAFGRQMRSPLLLLVGAVATLVGFAGSLQGLIAAVSSRVARSARSFSWRLGARRAEYDPSSVVRVLLGLCGIVVVAHVSIAVLADLRLAAGGAAGDSVVVVNTDRLDHAEISALMQIDSAAVLGRSATRVVSSSTPAGVVQLTCDRVADISELVTDCIPDTTYRVTFPPFQSVLMPGERLAMGSLSVPTAELGLALGDIGFSALHLNDIVITSEMEPQARPDEITMVVHPDSYIDVEREIASIAPLALFQTSRDPVAVADYRRHITETNAAWMVGGLLSVLSFVVATMDRVMERRRNVAALVALGIRKSDVRRSQLAQIAIPLLVSLTIANAIGWLVGQAYLTVGGLFDGVFLGSLSMGIQVAALSMLVGIAAAQLVSIPRDVPSHLHAD